MLLFRYVYFLFVFVVLKCVYAVSSPPPEAPIQCFRNACDDSVNQDCCVPTPAEASSGELDEPARCKTVYSYITRATTVTVSESMLGMITCVL